MSNVIVRSLVLLAVSTAIVLVSAFAAPPASPSHTTATTTKQGEPAGHDMSGMTMTVNSEAALITRMIPHHQEAVESAYAVLETTERPEVRELAQNVIATQTEEIATLEGWRDRWYPNAPEAAYAPMMADPKGLSPHDADRTFLEGMVEHHQGAMGMAQSYLEANYEKRSDVIQMAEVIVNAQTGEITQMRDWLNEWLGEVEDDHNAR